MHTTLATLALLSFAGSPTYQDEAPKGIVEATPEIGLSLFVPKSISSKTLIRYAKDIATAEDWRLPDGRERFSFMEGAIGVLGAQERRVKYVAYLADLDERLGGLPSQAAEESIDVTRTIRMRAMSASAAMLLINNLQFEVAVFPVPEAGSLVLRGAQSNVERAANLLAEVDQPLPQMTLTCEVYEMIPKGEEETALISAEVANALEMVHPGRSFRRSGRAIIRSSVGGSEPVELNTSMGSAGPDAPAGAPGPRMKVETTPSAWDAKAGILTLEKCSVSLETPQFAQTMDGEGKTIRQFNGYHREQLSASLGLHVDETTIVGSLGGEPVYIALRFVMH